MQKTINKANNEIVADYQFTHLSRRPYGATTPFNNKAQIKLSYLKAGTTIGGWGGLAYDTDVFVVTLKSIYQFNVKDIALETFEQTMAIDIPTRGNNTRQIITHRAYGHDNDEGYSLFYTCSAYAKEGFDTMQALLEARLETIEDECNNSLKEKQSYRLHCAETNANMRADAMEFFSNF